MQPEGRTLQAVNTHRERRLRLVAIASLCALQLAISLNSVSELSTVHDQDTAWYYSVARNFALGRGFIDNIVWQYLVAPEMVQRPIGEYWSPGWPLALGALMKVFGHSERRSLWICACLSVLVPLLGFLLTQVLGREQSTTNAVAAGWIAGLLVVIQPMMQQTHVYPDSALPYHIAVLFSLWIFLVLTNRPGRSAAFAAGLAASLPSAFRGEGFLMVLATVPVVALIGGYSLRTRLLRFAAAAAGSMAFKMALCSYNLIAFGHLQPLPLGATPWMINYSDLFVFVSDPTFENWRRQGIDVLTSVIGRQLRVSLQYLGVVVPVGLLLTSLLGGLALLRRRNWRGISLVLFVVLSWIVPFALVPQIARGIRFAPNVEPVLCVLAGIGIVAVANWIQQMVMRLGCPGPSRICGASSCAILIGLAGSWYFPAKLSFRSPVNLLAQFRELPRDLVAMAERNRNRFGWQDVVLTDEPCQVTAYLDVSSVMVPWDWAFDPSNGTAALEQVIARYQPKYILLRQNAGSYRSLLRAGIFRQARKMDQQDLLELWELKPEGPEGASER